MNIPLYDKIGHEYNRFRQPDIRLANKLMEFFPIQQNATLLEIGCGTGNYTRIFAEKGYSIVALDPSMVMLKQCVQHKNIFPLLATAENLPHDLPATITTVVAIMSVQHWSNPIDVVNTLHQRFPAAPILLVTFDPRLSEPMWFYDYFPDLYQLAHKQFPCLQEWQNYFMDHQSLCMEVIPFLITDDFSDKFAPTQWKHPAAYLDPVFRQATSGFFSLSNASIDNCVARLKKDLRDGAFYKKYADNLSKESYDLGVRLVRLS